MPQHDSVEGTVEGADRDAASAAAPGRRDFLAASTSLAMAGGLAASYGTFGYMAGRFLYPAGEGATAWMFVTELKRLGLGESMRYRAPDGASVNITRIGPGSGGEDFLALSSTCPHLGCQVHWEPQNERFFCPCHNGAFDAAGTATAGPPAEAGQSLPRYELRVDGALLFIRVRLSGLARRAAAVDGGTPGASPAHRAGRTPRRDPGRPAASSGSCA